MSNDSSYTTEDISRLLKISKLTVYDLIKKGELPSYRVGKQMRVDAADLEAYKQRSKTMQAANQPNAAEARRTQSQSDPIQSVYSTTGKPTLSEHSAASHAPTAPIISSQTTIPAASGSRQLVITGQDMSLDLLAKHMERNIPGIRPLRAFVGSLDSLISMYMGESDIVSTHLLDGDTGEYNLPYIRKLLVGSSYVVVNLVSRQAGLYVQHNNPLKLHHWSDLNRPGLRLVNREKGSGARVLLDEQLRLQHMKSTQLNGYDQEETSHLAVAGKVAAGEADVGVGIEKAALIVGNIEFIPLIQERYDLVMLKKPENKVWLEHVLHLLKTEAFHNDLRSIHGYDLSLTGQILYET
ncbi:putative molybdopterin biosynthesis protein [Paenibacillus sp. 1_12]|uniref:substrate-binding domain-containing protein n=1 Tax=Paenibacillus sp. 1_12 TaxID=1566278 RepID=UPI0008E6C4BD|nr:helix-turn-helix transcriptional regulator [Paenibacillus sp. 1_12]SFL34410.1 putative molybdopterin biosynthesis protein [Paenibacillus sp. 1_12]